MQNQTGPVSQPQPPLNGRYRPAFILAISRHLNNRLPTSFWWQISNPYRNRINASLTNLVALTANFEAINFEQVIRELNVCMLHLRILHEREPSCSTEGPAGSCSVGDLRNIFEQALTTYQQAEQAQQRERALMENSEAQQAVLRQQQQTHQRQLAEEQALRQQTEQSVKDAAASRESLIHELEGSRATVAAIQEQLKLKEQQNVQLEQGIKTLKEELQQTHIEKATTMEQLRTQRQQIEELHRELDQKRQEALQQLRDTAQPLEQLRREKDLIIKHVTEQLHTVQKEFTVLQGEKERLGGQLEMQQQSIAEAYILKKKLELIDEQFFPPEARANGITLNTLTREQILVLMGHLQRFRVLNKESQSAPDYVQLLYQTFCTILPFSPRLLPAPPTTMSRFRVETIGSSNNSVSEQEDDLERTNGVASPPTSSPPSTSVSSFPSPTTVTSSSLSSSFASRSAIFPSPPNNTPNTSTTTTTATAPMVQQQLNLAPGSGGGL